MHGTARGERRHRWLGYRASRRLPSAIHQEALGRLGSRALDLILTGLHKGQGVATSRCNKGEGKRSFSRFRALNIFAGYGKEDDRLN